jgi:transposase-like protein
MMFVRFPLSLRNVKDLLQERGINISQETARFWWNRFGPIPSEKSSSIFAALKSAKQHIDRYSSFSALVDTTNACI